MLAPILTPPLVGTASAAVASQIASFGEQLLSSFDDHGYAYVRRGGGRSNAEVQRAARALIGCVDPAAFDDNDAVHLAVRSLRGPYRFKAASGAADDIRCYSIGNPAPLDQLRGAYFDTLRDRQQAELTMNALRGRRNVWPAGFADAHREVLSGYYDECQDLAVRCASAVEAALRPGDTARPLDWPRWMSRRDSHLEAKLYAAVSQENKVVTAAESLPPPPPARKSKILRRTSGSTAPLKRSDDDEQQPSGVEDRRSLAKVRMDVHSDLSVVTLLLQDEVGGLEVFDRKEREFVAVPASTADDVLLVHAGTFLEFWSGGITATPHRVRTVAGSKDRCSLVFFAFPNFDATIDCSHAARPPFVAGDLHPALF